MLQIQPYHFPTQYIPKLKLFSHDIDYHPNETSACHSPFTFPAMNAIQRRDMPQNTSPARNTPTLSTIFDNVTSRTPPNPPPPPPKLLSNLNLLLTKQVQHSWLLVVRIIFHYTSSRSIKYTFQLTNNFTRSDITENHTSPGPLGKPSLLNRIRTRMCVD